MADFSNPRVCVGYVSNRAAIDGCQTGTEGDTRNMVFENAQATTVGQISISAILLQGSPPI